MPLKPSAENTRQMKTNNSTPINQKIKDIQSSSGTRPKLNLSKTRATMNTSAERSSRPKCKQESIGTRRKSATKKYLKNKKKSSIFKSW